MFAKSEAATRGSHPRHRSRAEPYDAIIIRRRDLRHVPAPPAARLGLSVRVFEAGDGVGGTWY